MQKSVLRSFFDRRHQDLASQSKFVARPVPIASAKKRTASQPTLDPAEAAKLAKLQADLDKADVCAFIGELDDGVKLTNELELIDDAKASSELQFLKHMMIAPAGTLAITNINAQDEIARYYRALYLGGLLEGVPKPEHPDASTALSLFSELIGDQPENGAYYYFRAAVRSTLGQGDDLIKDDLLRASEARDFDTKVTLLASQLYEWGLENANRYMIMNSVLSTMPIPNYNATNKLVAQALAQVSAAEDPAFADRMFDLGTNMMQVNLKGSSGREFVYWLAIEYQVGLVIAKEAWVKSKLIAGEGTALPPELKRSYHDLLAENKQKKSPLANYSEFLFSTSNPDKCDSSKVEELLDEESRAYRERVDSQ